MKLINHFLSILILISSPCLASICSKSHSYSPRTPESISLEPKIKRPKIECEKDLFSNTDSSTTNSSVTVDYRSQALSPNPAPIEINSKSETMPIFSNYPNLNATSPEEIQITHIRALSDEKNFFIEEFCNNINIKKSELLRVAESFKGASDFYLNPEFMPHIEKMLWKESIEGISVQRKKNLNEEDNERVWNINGNVLEIFPPFNHLSPKQQDFELTLIAEILRFDELAIFQAMHHFYSNIEKIDKQDQNNDAIMIIDQYQNFITKSAIITTLLNCASNQKLRTNPKEFEEIAEYFNNKISQEGSSVNYVQAVASELLFADRTQREKIAKENRISNWIASIVTKHHNAIVERDAQELARATARENLAKAQNNVTSKKRKSRK